MTAVEDKVVNSVNSRNSPKISEEISTPALSPGRESSSTDKNERETTSSPDLSCAICLCKLENKSFTDSCFHQFCFTCLLEWSKVKAECPLCKQAFKSIIHNVRSIEDYDQYHLRPEPPRPLDLLDGRRFRYRSTMTAERRHALALRQIFTQTRTTPPYFSWERHRIAMTSDSRREVYLKGIRVRPVEQIGVTRIRDVSPGFFRENPGCTHRLLPWVNRELVVLLENHESRVAFVMELILSLIQRFSILSPEFAEHIRPYLQMRTEHFVHEFYNFARSPWDIYLYDQKSVYPEAAMDQSGLSPDSDVMVLSPTNINNSPRVSNLWSSIIAMPSSSSSDSEGPTHNPEPPTSETALQRVKKFIASVNSVPDWPSPPLSWNSPISSTLPILKIDDLSNDLLTTSSSPQPGPSGLTYIGRVISDSSDSSDNNPNDDDCVIVDVEKPVRERTPVIIDLVSSTEDEDEDEENSKIKDGDQMIKRHDTSSSDSSASSIDSSLERKPRYKSVIGSYKIASSSNSSDERWKSPLRWRWTAQENGGTLQRSYSKSTSTSRSRSNSEQRLSSSPRRHGKSSKSKKHHKKHKHKHHHRHHRHRDREREDTKQNHKCKKHYMGHKSSRRES